MYTNLVSVETLNDNLHQPTWAVVDCRSRLDDPTAGRTLYLTAHIAGAVYADLNRDLAALPAPSLGRHPLPDMDTFRATLGRWGIDATTQVVAYDDAGGAYAARLWWMLRYLGHEAVAVLDGGWQAWQSAGYLTAADEELRPPTTFHGEPNPTMLATQSDVDGIVAGTGRGVLLDARDPKRYRGEVEPIDSRAGHIPTAKNRFYSDNLDEARQFRPADALRHDFDALRGEHAPDEVVLYCGSGVTACHNALAMSVAGVEGARLYVPSWSGWSSDPARPIETDAE